MRHYLALAPALLLGACMGASEPPVAAQAPVQAVPVAPVTASALPPPSGGGATVVTSSGASAPPPGPGGMSQAQVATMARAPGARESASLSNVSRTPSSGGGGGGTLGGTIVGGQSAGVIPSTVDRNRPEPRRVSVPRDPLGPGTPPPVLQPELRDTTGNSLRNRQRVEF
ncbi:MAG: hypothetical protein JNK84_18290 [Phreatobacter sp.]|uniref:hypothetical protein n=1 Tax=Phreatobacter sp. TaxID=1966341 RepID=UPI001A539494|nr:hypothetical protein [Phreatobacter sp.]MBL8571025.1 hypothetical protein [Phreatobacter sp.]